MKHFLINIEYKVPFEDLSDAVSEHRAFLSIGYEKKMLLMSGPKTPKTGGIIIAKAETIEEVKAFFDNDPYLIKNLAEHKIIEFNPVLYQDFISEWI